MKDRQQKIVFGSETLSGTTVIQGLESEFTHVSSIRVERTRALGEKIEIGDQKGDIVELVFDDGTHWIGNADDIDEVYGRKAARSRAAGDEFEFSASLGASGGARGKGGFLKLFNLFRPKKVAKRAAKELALLVDHKFAEEETLYRVSDDFELTPSGDIGFDGKPYLVLLHGTISNTEQSFHGLSNEGNRPWPEIHNSYEGRVLAWDHFTLSKSVIENALDLLELLPDGISIDIMSGSRGGLVADVLARCDRRNEVVGFSKEEIRQLRKKDKEEHQADLLEKLTETARKRGIQVGRIMRVACPGSGTSLLSRRIDHFLNALLSTIGFAFGIGVGPVFQTIRSLLLEIVKQRYETDAMPGMWSMVPYSPFQIILNSPESKVSSQLFVIEGDAKFGGKFGYSLLVILTNLFYRTQNDFVIETHRMKHGASRAQGVYLFTSRDKTTYHLNYFNKTNSQAAIVQALTSDDSDVLDLYERKAVGYEDRGVALGLIEFKALSVDNVSGNRPVVVMLPGIMGSFIYSGEDLIWVDLRQINKGRLVDHLHYNADDVESKALIARYYKKLADHLQKTHDVVTIPFDWRRSVTEASDKLAQVLDRLQEFRVPVQVLAHSMGGLVVRQYMMDHEQDWKNFISKAGSRFVMLGTPWLGSYLIVQVLTGHAKKVKLLSFLDRKHSKLELLEMLCEYRGVFELLPIDAVGFEDQGYWNKLKRDGNIKMHIPGSQVLQHFRKFKQRVESAKFDFTNVIYVAGKHDTTVNGYEFRNRYFRDDIVFLGTSEGDGSVTWGSGIPSGLDPANLYYAHATHTQLSNDEKLFKGITELLTTGRTAEISQNRPVERGGEQISEVYEEFDPVFDIQDALDQFYDADTRVTVDYEDVEQIRVAVVNAHLRMATYPIMAGHFAGDGIVSAEKVIDSQLDNRLSEMHLLGRYPGVIGDSEIVFDDEAMPCGAIITGLGVIGELTTFNLSMTVQHAVLRYMRFVRDNVDEPHKSRIADGVSFLLVGSGFGSLSVSESIRGILLGVAGANRRIAQLDTELIPIRNVEFVEFYEEKAASAYYSLLKGVRLDQRVNYTVVKGIERKYGAKRQGASTDDGSWWWHRFSTTAFRETREGDVLGLEFNSSSGIARVEQQRVMIPARQIEILLRQLSDSVTWSPKMAKTLFEMLVPNDFKEILRSQHNVIWRMDTDVAQWPWELLYDIHTDEEPSFVNSGMIRQLITENYRQTPYVVAGDTALVIGDPEYGMPELPQLDGALEEARKVNQILAAADFKTTHLERKKAAEIMCALYADEYRVLHFAGHGLYDPEGLGIGIAVGDGELLTPAHLKQLPYVPDFVFVNCCLSGKILAADQAYYMDRYKLAANIGTQLITMGVKAVIITGWEVNDQGALTFAETFYDQMRLGETFGNAVKIARKACFQVDPTSSTWAAYQCYGDQFFSFNIKSDSGGSDKHYILKSEVIRDLDNLFSDISYAVEEDNTWAFPKLQRILQASEDLLDGQICERQAMICAELGLLEPAVEAYKRMLEFEYAEFSVKAIEQYCNVRLKLLLQKFDSGVLKADELSEFDDILRDLKALVELGETGERHALLGSAHKHGARMSNGEKRIEHLSLACDAYSKAYAYDQKWGNKKEVYYTTNFITLAYLIHPNDKAEFEESVKELVGTRSKPYLAEMLTIMEAKAVNSDRFYDRLSEINIRLVIMLTASDAPSVMGRYRNEIIALYRKAFVLTKSEKKRKTEVDHLQFLITSGRLSQNKERAFTELKNAIDKM